MIKKKKANSKVAMKRSRLNHRNTFIFIDMYFEVKGGQMRTY